ncbi:uncharacterized protein LOC130184486 [Seriola aureovittata]|uniref:uncharacterized protein LOC130184486 n=1 Tax=Seriola aureovittata TaxID=2871759 RepID=UPI0024BDFE07|nr:uncharacterized protein LOC130184486 [Seriola aureovittata]
MENSCVEQFISSLAQSLKPGYLEFISKLNSSECSKEIDLLLSDKGDAQTASKGPLLRCVLLNFHRQTSISLQSQAALEEEVKSLRAQNAFLLQEVKEANKKAMRYLGDLHAAEVDLCSHKEELLRVKSECFAPPRSVSACDSGFSASHSSLNDRLTPPPLRGWGKFPTDPKSWEMKSAPQPPLRDRGYTHLTSHLPETDNEETGSLSGRGYSCSHQPLMHNSFTCAHPSNRRTKTFPDCSASSLHLHESDDCCSAPSSSPASIVSPSSVGTSQCPRLEALELLAKDIEHFDPDSSDQHIENYFKELDHNLIDLPHATQREKTKLVWKTSSKAVHKFMQSLPPSVRDDYKELCQALTEEFSPAADEIESLVAASQIKHSRHEHPNDFYQRLRHAYFQGRNTPGLEQNSTFKSLFLRNLHPCVRTHVTLMTHQGKPTMQEIKKMTKMAWETMVNSKARGKTTEPSNSNTLASHRHVTSKDHPQNRSKGGDKRPHMGAERNRHAHQVRRDRHSHNRSRRRPYAEILAQTQDQSTHGSDNDHVISDHVNSDSDNASECSSFSYSKCYSFVPQVKENLKHRRSRVRRTEY